MNYRTTLLAVVALLLPVAAQSATVWKCKEGDRVVFSDAPCPSTGTPMDPGKLRGNVVRAQPVPPKPRYEADAPPPGLGTFSASSGHSPTAGGNVCPSEQEIRNMEVSARSATRSKKEIDFLQDEIRRARQCRKGQGNYTEDDWRISRDAQAAQGSVIHRKRQDAKARAEGMHSAADPIEGDRIQRERLAEEERRAIRARQGEEANGPPNAPHLTRGCNQNGCWDNRGQFYRRIGDTDKVIGPQGRCTVRGSTMRCP